MVIYFTRRCRNGKEKTKKKDGDRGGYPINSPDCRPESFKRAYKPFKGLTPGAKAPTN